MTHRVIDPAPSDDVGDPSSSDVGVLVRCESLVHVYGEPGAEVAALRGVDLLVRRGETVALLGPSGSGKSTLLWQLAGLLRPTAGSVDVCGHRLAQLSAAQLADLRRREVGILMQNAARNLLPYLTAIENVRAVQRPRADLPRRALRTLAGELLDAMGIAELAHRSAGRLSGGEQQRLALAVALANRPRLLLADEPTSHLDSDSGAAVIELIREVNRSHDTTVVLVTHDAAVGGAMQRTVTIRDGRIGAAGVGGEDFLVVDRDGGLTLPVELFDVLPPGSLVRAVRTPDGVELRRATGGPA